MPWKTRYLDILNIFLFMSCTINVTMVVLPTFWKIIYFCSKNGPLSNVIFSALYFKHSLINWRLKCMEMTGCLQNCRFYRTIISNFSSKVKLKLIEKLSISADDFYPPNLRCENVIFQVAPPGHTGDNLWKNDKYIL